MDIDAAGTALELIQEEVLIQPITPATSLHNRALSWAGRLAQTKAYDAQYLAPAEEMSCGLLTTGRRLAQAAQALGTTWAETPG